MEDMTVAQIELCRWCLTDMRRLDEYRWLEDHKFKNRKEMNAYITELRRRRAEYLKGGEHE